MSYLTLGLRFSKSQARVLRAIAYQLASRGVSGEDVGLFDKAADSARDGEPLVVRCTDPAEVEQMAEGFVRFGVKRPAVESLSG